jgi:serine/threonine-protein kinase mTOR
MPEFLQMNSCQPKLWPHLSAFRVLPLIFNEYLISLDGKSDINVFGGVITLLSFMKSPPCALISQHLPAIFDVIWYGLYNIKYNVREKSAILVGECLKLQAHLGNHGKSDAANIYCVYRSRILDESISAIRSGVVCNTHGAILTLRTLFNLSENDKKFILYHESYILIMETSMKLIYSKDSILRQSAIDFVPYLVSRDIFIENYLNRWISFLIESIKKEKDRPYALKSLASTIFALDAKTIEPYLELSTNSLRAILQLKGRYRDMDDLNASLKCICAFSETCGPMFQRNLFQLFPAMMSSGLWSGLIDSLQIISKAIPNVVYVIEDPLMNEIKSVFNDLDSSVENLALAIKCLGSFEFTEPIISSYIGQKLSQIYLNYSDPSVRSSASETILKLNCNLLKSNSQLEPKWICRNFIAAVLTRMVADEDFRIPEKILLVLKENQCSDLDILLAHSDCIRPLFVFLGSNNVPLKLRTECADLLGRVTPINFASCLPNYRKLLLQYLSEIECINSPGLLHRDDSAKLLYRILLWDESFVVPYTEALLDNIIMKIKDKQISFSESMLNCIGRLSLINPDCITDRLDLLLDILSDLIQDQSSNVRRKASLSALSTILGKVCREKVQNSRFCSILSISVLIIKNELDHEVRREAIRLMGVIGAIDPYLMKALEKTGLSVPKMEESVNEVPSHSLNSTPEEFYARIAVNSLLNILKDSTLSMHHMVAAQALVYLFRTLGQRSNQFLTQVLPVFYPIVQNCAPNSTEFYIQQLSVLVGVVGVHIGPHAGEIVNLLTNKWYSQQPSYPALLNLINVLAQALKGEFRLFVPRILPAILTILECDAVGMASRPFTIQKSLQTVAVLGCQISDYAGVIGDSLVLLLRNSTNFSDIRVAALRSTASICKDVSAVADNPAILQSLLGILEYTDEAEIQEYCLDAMVVVALAQGRDFFRFVPLVTPVVSRRKIQHAAFEKLITSNLNSPAKLAELTSESLRLMELKISDLTLVAGDFSGLGSGAANRSLAINEALLIKSFDPSQCSDRESWFEWIRRLGIELLRESPSPALRTCASLANIYYTFGKELFNAAFASCLGDCSSECRAECIISIEMALASPIIPSEVAQQLLNVAEFMERQERPLPIGMHTLGTQAARFHAYAKALYYKELEFLAALQAGVSPSSQVIEALISINNQVQQPDAALGVLIHANKAHGIVLKESWYEKLQRWDEALKAYEAKWQDDPSSHEAVFGILRCRHALGEWDELNGVAQKIWTSSKDSVRSAIAPLAAASAWGLQDWTHLQQYVQALKPESADSIFFQTILSIHSKQMNQARHLIDKTRDLIDTELTALLSESYSRAYK